MNWRRITLWVFMGLAVWLGLMLFSGMVFGLLNPHAKAQPIVYMLGGMLVPLLVFIRYSPFILGLLIGAVIIWVIVAKHIPIIEANKQRLMLNLGMFSFLIGFIIWWWFPLDRSLAPIGAISSIISLMVPRFITKKLSPGVFTT